MKDSKQSPFLESSALKRGFNVLLHETSKESALIYTHSKFYKSEPE